MAIDVTRFVRNHPNQEVTFLVAREVRVDGENVDDALAALRLASRENSTNPGPQLVLSLSDFALPGDFDHSGTVDADDFAFWKANLGNTNSAADGNRNGIVDAADFIVWRENHGKSLPGSTGGSALSALVPEPSAALLAWLALAAINCRRVVRNH
jgi:hypothetical protein